MTTTSRWPLAGFYACYFAVIGVWIPFWPLYLAHLGYGAQTIGLLTALMQWIKIPAPPLWGRLADRGSRHTVIVLTCIAAFCAFTLFFLGTGVGWVVVATTLYSLFHAGPLALTDSLAMELCVQREWDYGIIRLWGSWGFILFSLGVGPLTDQWGMEGVPWTIALLLLLSCLFALKLPRTTSPPWSGPAPALFDRADVRWFYFASLLMQFSHGAYYGFMSLHLQQQGYSRTAIGLLWALGVAAEVGLMVFSKPLLARFGVSRVLTFSLLMAAMRWSLYATTVDLHVLIAAQLLHAFTFAAFHIAAVRRVYEMAPVHGRGTAQGWLSALSYGAGGGMGMALSGLIFDRLGYEILFAIMALAALAGVGASHRSGILFHRWEHAHV
ncbi:MAG: MFS transporter [Magnetococcales bacterium]|nr:MFS transporter [Magnetococcales bacterium]